MKVYKGDQTFAQFLLLSAQTSLFDAPSEDRAIVKRKLDVMAASVVLDLGVSADWADLKDTLKSRAAGKVLYDADLIVTALGNAMRTRGQATV